jgi:CubicO group peptidase (beta-lactamase class C family)
MRSFVFIALFSLFGAACFSQNDEKKPAGSTKELKEQLEKVLEEMHVPGISVAIVRREGPEWVAGLGKADVASGRAATAETLFRIGSVSKTFASLAILMLVDQGKLSLEDSVRTLVPEVWFENRWEATDPVRVVHLLEHTTGWDDVHLREYAVNAPTMGLLKAFNYDHHSRISRWRPGTRMAYCNSGPPVAAYIVEKITGQRFEEYVEQNFFKPIGIKTATYFQPPAESTTILYQDDGKRPYSYWNFLYPPSGSINASANDMASYLHFYLNRGSVKGTQVMPAAAIERMESPKSTWAAKEGLRAGYGLSNYWSVYEGFVYHGHNGGVEGGLTDMAYMPDQGIGYFYSINSGNGDAFNKIGTLIRAYSTRALQRPPIPPVAPLPAQATEYTGWYEPDSPRLELTYFFERLMYMTYVHFEGSKLLMTSLSETNATFLPVMASQFRYVPKNRPPDPIPTAELLAPKNTEGTFIQLGLGMATMKRLPTWLALTQIAITGFVVLSIISILIYAPFWIFSGFNKRRRRPAERAMRFLPFIAVLSLVSGIVICIGASDLFIELMGNRTSWSFSLFLATIIFACASVASVIALWYAPRQGVRGGVRLYSTIVTIALMITTAYLAYWGIIGLRTWA